MAKNPYSDLTTLQLADVYFTTKNSYGKVEGDLLEEVNKRGGENSFQEQIETEKKLTKEKARIREEVFSLMSDHQDSSLIFLSRRVSGNTPVRIKKHPRRDPLIIDG